MSDAISQAVRAKRREGSLGVIAEVKRRGADGSDLLRGRSCAQIAAVYRNCGAAAISVVTSYVFGGSMKMLNEVAAANLGLPILRKDLIRTQRDIEASKRVGASAVLFVVQLLGLDQLSPLLAAARKLDVEPFVEVSTKSEIDAVRKIHDGIIAINNADIRSNEREGEGISRSVTLIDRDDARVWISASRIHGPQDVTALAAAGFDGILIGTQLLQADDLTLESRRIVAAADSQSASP